MVTVTEVRPAVASVPSRVTAGWAACANTIVHGRGGSSRWGDIPAR